MPTPTETPQPDATTDIGSATPPELPPELPAEPMPPATHAVGDEIDGLGIVAGVRVVRGEGEYVKLGSPDADWTKL